MNFDRQVFKLLICLCKSLCRYRTYALATSREQIFRATMHDKAINTDICFISSPEKYSLLPKESLLLVDRMYQLCVFLLNFVLEMYYIEACFPVVPRTNQCLENDNDRQLLC